MIIICGPTASGKSTYAKILAQKLNGSIVNADSCQVYNSLPILTSSPSDEEKKSIPHYLYNYVDILACIREFSVAQYLSDATQILKSITESGKTPIIVGGTGMYINALMNNISNIPAIPTEFKNSIKNRFNELGQDAFYQELLTLDPLIRHKIYKTDTQRILRAYEVIKYTNKSLVHYHSSTKQNGYAKNAKIIFIKPPRDKLYSYCDARFDTFIKNGAIDEVKYLSNMVDCEKLKTIKIIGFREIIEYLNGTISLSEATEIAKLRTRQYAKRQLTWFNNQITPTEIFGDIYEGS